MFLELARAFAFIFLAEMGDKTQILAMAFATKYKVKHVVIGIVIGSFLNHALAVLLGSNLQRFVPLDTLSIIAGFSFVFFGIWSLRFDDEEDEKKNDKNGPITTVAIAFFIGELGDKTQLTAIALSADATYPIFILMGTVLGMAVTGLVGIFVGIKLGSKVDDFYVKILASIVFFTFGYIKLFESLPFVYLTLLNVSIFTLVVAGISLYLLIPIVKVRFDNKLTVFQLTARKLKDYYSDMYNGIEKVCLGEEVCGGCSGNKCLVGYTKGLLLRASMGKEVNPDYLKNDFLIKDYSRKVVLEAYYETIMILKENWVNKKYNDIHYVRKVYEQILYQKQMEFESYDSYLSWIQYEDEKLYKILKNT